MKPLPSDEARVLFLELLDLPDDDRRRALDEHAGLSPSLRAEVEALLADDARAEGFLEPPPLPTPADHDAEARWLEGRRIGRYALVRRVGIGGMGTVYEAVQERPRRRVAVKLLRTGVVTPQVLRRFELESEILGRLRHPGIAEIYEAGTHESELGPIPFFALEYVEDARSLTRYAIDEGLDVPARLRLLASVCDAVHHAHEAGVIHRDIKPSNVLVGPDGRPRLIDFGVARATDDERGVTLGTQAGELLGTLCYMSPEQCAGDGAEVDARTDVYSLGVLAYELLTGRLPYPVERSSVFAVTELVRTHVPRPLAVRGAPRPRDVDAVVLRALEKLPHHRYESARALAEDLRRAAEGQPVVATASRRSYALRVLAWRGRRALPGLAAVAGTAIGAWGLVRATSDGPPRAAPPAAPAAPTEPAPRPTVASTGAAHDAEREAYHAAIADAERALAAGEPARARQVLEACDPALRGFEWHRLRLSSDGSAQVLPVGLPLHALLYEPDTRTLLAAAEGGDLHAWQAGPTGGPPIMEERWARPTGDDYLAIAIDPAAGMIYGGGDRMLVQAFDLATGEPRGSFASGPGSIWSLAVTPTPAHLVIARQRGIVERWDLASRTRIDSHAITPRLGELELVGEAFYAAVSQGVTLRSLGSARELAAFATPEQPEAILPLERELWVAGWESRIYAFDRATGAHQELAEQAGGLLDLERVGASTVASAGRDGSIVLWDVARREPVRALRGHDHGVEALAVGDDGAWLASASLDGTVRTWDLGAPPPDLALVGAPDKVNDVAFVDDGRALVAAVGPYWEDVGADRLVRWSLPDGRVVATADDHATTVELVEAGPGDVLASASRGGELVLRSAIDLAPRHRINAHARTVRALAFSPDGARLCSADEAGVLLVSDASDGRLLARAELERGAIDDVAWVEDGLYAAVDGALVRWTGQEDDGLELLREAGPGGMAIARIAAIAGGHVIVGGPDGTIARVALGEDEPAWSRTTFGRAVAELAVSPDGERVAVASQDQRIRLHDARTGTLLITVGEHEAAATSVAFSPDGSTLASGGFDKRARVWRSR